MGWDYCTYDPYVDDDWHLHDYDLYVPSAFLVRGGWVGMLMAGLACRHRLTEEALMGGKRELKAYRGKRDLRSSPEPGGERGGGEGARFVVQKHDASTLHYDLRLEAGGVLKSWAVPKGPSTDPREKRLAMRTEDHPVAYATFEGVIPEGEYGAGTVMVWDAGTYRNIKEADEEGGEAPSVERQVEAGHVTVWLEGEKLRGGYALTRTGGSGDEERWLLVKMRDEEADARRNPTSTEGASARSGRSMEEIREEEGGEG